MIRFSIHNYKEWMAAYVDGSLSREDMLLADAFLQKHPHLMDEYLEELEEFSLMPEENTVSPFNELQIVIIPTLVINQYNFTEYFIGYYEGLLSVANKKELEQFLQLNPKLQKEFKIYGSTRLVADGTIQYPGRHSLYKRTRPAIPLYIRYAVAASVLIVISLFAFWPSKEQNGIALKDSGNTNIPSTIIDNNIIEINQQLVNKDVNTSELNNSIEHKQRKKDLPIQTHHKHIAPVEMAVNTPATIHPSEVSLSDLKPEKALQEIKSVIIKDYLEDNSVAEEKPTKKGLFNKIFGGEKTYIEDYVNATFTAFNDSGEDDNKWVLKVERDKNGKSKKVKFSSPIFSAKSNN